MRPTSPTAYRFNAITLESLEVGAREALSALYKELGLDKIVKTDYFLALTLY
jgi:hypothetical protein